MNKKLSFELILLCINFLSRLGYYLTVDQVGRYLLEFGIAIQIPMPKISPDLDSYLTTL